MRVKIQKVLKKSGKVLNALYWVLFVSLAVIAVLILFTTLDTDLPIKIYTVQSGSMAPEYKKGSVIFVSSADEYNVKDVITYKNPDNERQTITHRISAIEYQGEGEDLYTTKGDANEDADTEKINESLIIGKVTTGIPYLGHVINFARTRTGVILLVVFPASIFVISELKNLSKAIKIYKKGGEIA